MMAAVATYYFPVGKTPSPVDAAELVPSSTIMDDQPIHMLSGKHFALIEVKLGMKRIVVIGDALDT